MALSFPVYCIVSSLQSMGWPRKKSLFGSVGVPGGVLRAVWAGMVQISVGVAAGRPFRACQLLTQMFNRDWSSEPGEKFLADLDPVRTINEIPGTPPWEVIAHRELQVIPPDEFIIWKDLLGSSAHDLWMANCATGLIYGLAHPGDAARALEADRSEYRSNAPGWIKAGLNIPVQPSWPDNESYYQWIEKIVEAYERASGRLPAPADALLKAAAVRSRLT